MVRAKLKRSDRTKRIPKVTQLNIPKPHPVRCGCFFHGHPLSTVLYVIGLIVIIYGAWFHELLWLVLGFVPIIIGFWWEHLIRK